jgi:hypothetical protein
MSETAALLRAQMKLGSLLGLCLLALTAMSCAGKNSPPAPANQPSSSPVAENSQPQPESPKKIYETGDAVPAGYLGYKVISSSFSTAGGASLLHVELAIVNTDKKERPVAAMKLVDETGKEYALSNKPAPSGGANISTLGAIPPAQSKKAVAVFEAPKQHEYKLKVQGFSATDEVQIKLKPAAKLSR